MFLQAIYLSECNRFHLTLPDAKRFVKRHAITKLSSSRTSSLRGSNRSAGALQQKTLNITVEMLLFSKCEPIRSLILRSVNSERAMVGYCSACMNRDALSVPWNPTSWRMHSRSVRGFPQLRADEDWRCWRGPNLTLLANRMAGPNFTLAGVIARVAPCMHACLSVLCECGLFGSRSECSQVFYLPSS